MYKEEIEQYDKLRPEIYLQWAEKHQQEIERYKKSSIYKNYMQMCKVEADLIKKLAGDYQNDIIYMAIFAYLYRNGYFSYNRYFEFGADDKEILYNLGVSVITGKGVCRNIAAHFRDVLKAIKVRNSSNSGVLIAGTRPDQEKDVFIPISELPKEFKINISEDEKAELQTDKNEERKQSDLEFLPNHAEVIVMDNLEMKNADCKLMLYDPTNIRITSLDYSSSVRTGKRRAIDLRCEIWDAEHCSTLEDRKEFIERFSRIAGIIEQSKRNDYSKRELEIIVEYARRQCNQNKDNIESFYNNYKVWYLLIKKDKDTYIKGLNKSETTNQSGGRG